MSWRDRTVHVVWGPTAEWADGTGPLAYFTSKADARRFIAAERRELADMAREGALGWPYADGDFWVVPTTFDALLLDGADDLTSAADALEYLNAR